MGLVQFPNKERPGKVVGISVSTPPDNSPLLAEVKNHLRVETNDEDVLLQRYIDAAVRYVELVSRKSLFDQQRTLVLDSFPCDDFIQLYSDPLKSVVSFTVYNTADVADATFADYNVDTAGCRLTLKYGYSWPVELRNRSAVVIVYATGHGLTVDDLPATLIEAVFLLAGKWFGAREEGCVITGAMAQGVADILGLDRRMHL